MVERVTPETLYTNRRRFIRGLGALAAVAVAACARRTYPSPTPDEQTPQGAETTAPEAASSSDELGADLTSFEAITNYTNYYELALSKEGLAAYTADFRASPWTVTVGGLVENPLQISGQALLSFPQQERVYRMRCVEGWSMVIPWVGFPLARLLEQVRPLPEARYVRFETLLDSAQLPGQTSTAFQWPYVEGLRLDEAMHDLTILATGLYGKPLTVQNGAPVRLVVPWKYGFKSIKSIVRIDLVAERPTSFWMSHGPSEYGFLANVNPNVPHPRWSQASERRIGELSRIPTLMFNGYGDQVASLYEGMDLRENF